MNNFQKTLLEQGKVINETVLKVDNFLNHCIDPTLMDDIGNQFAEYFKNKGITKVITIESGGIVPAYATALKLGVPLVFCKKAKPSTMNNPLTSSVFSFTKNTTYTLVMESDYLSKDDQILFIDDFLANGAAFKGIEDLISQKGAHLKGVGICIEKSWQEGHSYIMNKGYDLFCLASIASLQNGQIHFS